MRSLVLIGAIGLFIGTALVPPGGASVGAMIMNDSTAIDTVAVKSFFSGNPVSAVQLLRASAVLDNAARTPVVQTAIRTVGGTQAVETVSSLSAIATGDDTLTSQEAVTAVTSVAKTIGETLASKEDSTEVLASAIANADPALKRVLEKISWAKDKKDVRLCSDALGAIESSSGQMIGDMLALCLALVNGEDDRCFQIGDSGHSALCHTALAS
ncbi:MAG: hypothetical protein PHZ00_07090 [Candidatus Peribacteraceae bacterium]|nr:hypothetical protein [Candidatus Peribacteraceae bacterium]